MTLKAMRKGREENRETGKEELGGCMSAVGDTASISIFCVAYNIHWGNEREGQREEMRERRTKRKEREEEEEEKLLMFSTNGMSEMM